MISDVRISGGERGLNRAQASACWLDREPRLAEQRIRG